MASFFVMPQASPTMTVGVISKWVAAEGAALEPQSVIAQVETDKATMDIEVFDKGVMLKHLAAEGAEIPPGTPIAIIGAAAGEDISALMAELAGMTPGAPPAEAPPAAAAPAAAAPAAAAPAVAAPPAAAAPEAAPEAAPKAAPKTTPKAAAPSPTEAVVPRLVWAGKPIDSSIMEPLGPYVAPGRRLVASPLARAVAADRGVDIKRVEGTGPGGRIVAADVERAEKAPVAATTRRPDEAVRVTQMRKTIARRLTEVHQTVPVFYLTVTLDASGLVQLKEAAAARDVKVSYNDLFLKAVAAALVDVPACNAAWNGETIVRRGGVDIGVAVALPDGLITPIIRDADRKGARAIAEEVRALAARAREGKLQAEEYTGGSFSISNLGMFDIEAFTAILNPPEAGILAVGAVQQVPVIQGGALAVGWRMKVTMTCDHRVIDGALGAKFLQAVRRYVEFPALLAL